MPGILRFGRTLPVALGAVLFAAALAACGSTSATLMQVQNQPLVSQTQAPTGTATFVNATPTGPATPTPTAVPTPTPSPTIGPCSAVDVSIDITVDQGTYWQGAAGHKAAKFKLTNDGSAGCIVKAKSQPLLLNGDGGVLITGAAAGSSASLTVVAGSSISSQVQTGNLCHAPTIVAPVRVAFVLPGIGTVIATTGSPTDTGAIPPCLGDPGVNSGDITMTLWAP
jgi:hypothetical protein